MCLLMPPTLLALAALITLAEGVTERVRLTKGFLVLSVLA